MRLTRPKLTVGRSRGGAGAHGLRGRGHDGRRGAGQTATGSLEHIASEAGCNPDLQTDADEIRQATCKNTDGKFILATFATDRGQREWINGAKDYGGFYLVGRKWVAVGEQKMVTALRGQLGGTMEVGTDHSVHTGDGAGTEASPRAGPRRSEAGESGGAGKPKAGGGKFTAGFSCLLVGHSSGSRALLAGVDAVDHLVHRLRVEEVDEVVVVGDRLVQLLREGVHREDGFTT